MGRDYIKMNRFNGFSSLFFITFKKELKIMETVKTVRNTYKSLPRPRSWAEVKSKNLILNFNLFWTGVFVNIHLLNINLEYQYPYIYILIKKIMNKIIITVICIFVFVYNISFSQNKLSAGASFGGQRAGGPAIPGSALLPAHQRHFLTDDIAMEGVAN